MSKNTEVADIFRAIADILEIKGENPFRIRAYQRAAGNIESLSEDLASLAKEQKLKSIPGVGKDLAEKISEIVKTGKLKYYQGLKKTIPPGLTEMMTISGLGPKTTKLIYDNLKIKNISQLEKAAKAHKISGLPGIKDKTEENILKGIKLMQKGSERMPLNVALNTANEFVAQLKKTPEVKQIQPAGSLRRRKETVRDIDILVTSSEPKKVMDYFTTLPGVKRVLAKGSTKASILTGKGIQVDVRVVKPQSFGAALLYFTGSKQHNIRLREMAIKRGLKINEYGVFQVKGKSEKRIAGKTEEEIFKLFKLPYIVPELREDRGELEAGLAGKLPRLVQTSDIKGDLHVHSKYSDGTNSITEITQAAKARGYKYIAVTDHSQSLKVAGGLSISEIEKKMREINKINKKIKGVTVLMGTEVDIKSDGTLDYPDKLLKNCDVVIAAIHSGFKQSREKLTERIIAAMENRFVHIVAHPSGRLLSSREPYELDMEAVFKKAKETKTHLEINAFPERLDLTDIYCRRAKELGIKMAICTDAHIINQLDYMYLGVTVARRGWLEKKDIINTGDTQALLESLKK